MSDRAVRWAFAGGGLRNAVGEEEACVSAEDCDRAVRRRAFVVCLENVGGEEASVGAEDRDRGAAAFAAWTTPVTRRRA